MKLVFFKLQCLSTKTMSVGGRARKYLKVSDHTLRTVLWAGTFSSPSTRVTSLSSRLLYSLENPFLTITPNSAVHKANKQTQRGVLANVTVVDGDGGSGGGGANLS